MDSLRPRQATWEKLEAIIAHNDKAIQSTTPEKHFLYSQSLLVYRAIEQGRKNKLSDDEIFSKDRLLLVLDKADDGPLIVAGIRRHLLSFQKILHPKINDRGFVDLSQTHIDDGYFDEYDDSHNIPDEMATDDPSYNSIENVVERAVAKYQRMIGQAHYALCLMNARAELAFKVANNFRLYDPESATLTDEGHSA